MIRRFGKAPCRTRHYRPRPGVYAVLWRDGALLLTRQNGTPPEIQLPGGGVEPGEQPLRALHREVMEETGWRIASPRRLGAFRRFAWMPEYRLWAEKLCTIYLARPVRALGPPMDRDHTALWVPPAQASHCLADPGHRHFAELTAGSLREA